MKSAALNFIAATICGLASPVSGGLGAQGKGIKWRTGVTKRQHNSARERHPRLARSFSIALLVAAAGMMAAGPASASVTITPTSTTGFLHAANDGSASVDVTVCATFDQPVRYIEALVQFSGPILGVALSTEPAGGVTNWCGSYADISAARVPPGTDVVIDVSWSAHNGNGLSQGYAHAQGHFQIPGPAPKPPKKTPQQAADLGHASNAMWAATAIIAVGGIAISLLSGGVLAPAVLGLLGGGAAAYMAAQLGDLAIDPPDGNYAVVVVPQNLSLPVFVVGNGISPAAADALNALRLVQEDETGQAGAMLAALYKAEGAAAAGDLVWEQKQTLAAADFAHQLAVDLNSEPPLRSAARSALEAGGFPVYAITEQQAADGLADWNSPGLPSALKDAITLGGAAPGVDDRLHALAESYPASAFVQQNVLDLLAPASPQAGPNLSETANAEAAAALLAWSDALKVNPTGALPASPPIITGLQPNQGVEAGGTTVNIFGSNLLNTTQVNFGAQSTSNGSCSDTQCTVISPAGTGTVDVTATGPGGTSAVSGSDRFSYLAGVPGPIHLPANNLIASGGFDPPGSETVQSYETLVGTTGAKKLGGNWEILAGSVDLVGPSSGQAAEGVQFVDLNGNDAAGPGTISQEVATIPGHQYRLSFELAGNPNGDPVVKTLTASLGTTTQAFSFDTTGHTNLDLGWVQKNLDALSCGATLRATLATTTTGERGPNVDDVSMVDLGLAPAGSCIALATPQATLSPGTVSFGTAVVGVTTSPQAVTLTNSGTVALGITSVTLGGANASAFAIATNSCGASLDIGASCAVAVTFTPSGTGNFAGTLSVTDAAGVQVSNLSGSGTPPPPPPDFTISASPAWQSTTGSTTVTYTVQVAATSAGPFANPVALSATGAPEGVSVSFAPASVTPGAGTATSMMTVALSMAVGANRTPAAPRARRGLPAGISLSALLVGLLVRKGKRCWTWRSGTGSIALLVLGSLALASVVLTGCEHSRMTSNSILTITGISGSTTHQTSVSLIVDE